MTFTLIKTSVYTLLGYGLLVILLQGLYAYMGRENALISDSVLESRVVDFEGREIHYVRTKSTHEQAICFIPGSPGKWSHFERYLRDEDLRSNANLISIDRPGLGLSAEGGAEPSLHLQAEAIATVLEKEKTSAWIVGHSYGGSVAARLAMDHPERVDGLILIAAAVSPDHEKRMWYNHLADWLPIQWLLPRSLVTSNREMKPLKQELEAIRDRWKEIKVPVIVMHGEKDPLVPLEHTELLKTVIPPSQIQMVTDPDWNHFIPWNRYEEVKMLLEEILTTEGLEQHSRNRNLHISHLLQANSALRNGRFVCTGNLFVIFVSLSETASGCSKLRLKNLLGKQENDGL